MQSDNKQLWYSVFFLLTALFLYSAPATAAATATAKNAPVKSDTLPEEFQNLPEGLLLPENQQIEKKEEVLQHQLLGELPGVYKIPEFLTRETTSKNKVLSINEVILEYQKGSYALVLENLIPMAENGSAQAQELLGIMYMNGQGVSKDIEKAFDYFHSAAESGRPLAQHYFGILNFQGNPPFREANIIDALIWLRLSTLHYPEGAEKERAVLDREGVYSKATRLEKLRADEMMRDWLAREGKSHFLDLE